MVTRTFLTKCTTIFNGSKDNFGLNPIGMLNYGGLLSRCLLYFDTEKIEESIKNGGFDADNTTHTLKLTNCGSIDQKTFDELVISSDEKGVKERATSFSIIAFRIPEYWDAGRGFDNSTDFWLLGKGAPSQNGANWFNAYNGKKWGTEINVSGECETVQGIYSFERIEEEYEKFKNGEDSVIITEQHFDTGNENFELDITSYVKDILDGKYDNFGIGLAFSPEQESISTNLTQYVGFFTNHTNTFFEPYVETRCREKITDNRFSFYIGKKNRLYLYVNIDGVPTDLDDLPTCKITDGCGKNVGGKIYDAIRQKEGVYYAEVTLKKNSVEDNSILYDTWSNLVLDGEELDDEEMEFVALPKSSFLSVGSDTTRNIKIEPIISGINDNEKIYQGDERTLEVVFAIQYTKDYELMSEGYYRLYVKDGKREIDVIDWDGIDVTGLKNSFKIKSAELLPGEYHVDIKAKCGKDMRIFKDKLIFKVVDNSTELKK